MQTSAEQLASLLGKSGAEQIFTVEIMMASAHMGRFRLTLKEESQLRDYLRHIKQRKTVSEEAMLSVIRIAEHFRQYATTRERARRKLR